MTIEADTDSDTDLILSVIEGGRHVGVEVLLLLLLLLYYPKTPFLG